MLSVEGLTLVHNERELRPVCGWDERDEGSQSMKDVSGGSMAEKAAEVYAVAERLFAKKLDWVDFFNKVMGAQGTLVAAFPNKEQQAEFLATREYAAIQQMIAKLRENEDEKKKKPKKTTRMITVRLPADLHAALQAEADRYQTSVNKLCISKLLQLIDNDLVPEDRTAMLRGKAPARDTGTPHRRQRSHAAANESPASAEGSA